MKKSTNGNMYEASLDETRELFSSYLEEKNSLLVFVLSEHALAQRSRDALNKAFEAKGFGVNPCSFVSLNPLDNPSLDKQSLYLLIEGADPLLLVASDQATVSLLSEAYACDLLVEKVSRVFGRFCAAFTSFDSMLDSPQKKQEAWGLLKKLPTIEN